MDSMSTKKIHFTHFDFKVFSSSSILLLYT